MEATNPINPNALFMIKGADQSTLTTNGGQGFITNQQILTESYSSNPNAFFRSLLSKSYSTQVSGMSCSLLNARGCVPLIARVGCSQAFRQFEILYLPKAPNAVTIGGHSCRLHVKGNAAASKHHSCMFVECINARLALKVPCKLAHHVITSSIEVSQKGLKCICYLQVILAPIVEPPSQTGSTTGFYETPLFATLSEAFGYLNSGGYCSTGQLCKNFPILLEIGSPLVTLNDQLMMESLGDYMTLNGLGKPVQHDLKHHICICCSLSITASSDKGLQQHMKLQGCCSPDGCHLPTFASVF